MDNKIYLCRHGETEWALDGRHTGTTDIPLTERGKEEARLLGKRLEGKTLSLVLTSPLQRAYETAQLANVGDAAKTCPDAVEWNYGDYEGITTPDIHKTRPGWAIFKDGCPGGESAHDVGVRADRVIEELKSAKGDAALFAHGHFLRVLVVRWLGLDATWGKAFGLSTATLSIVGYVREERGVLLWNDASHLS